MMDFICKLFLTCIIFTMVVCVAEDASGGNYKLKAIAGFLMLVDCIIALVMILMAIWL